jgi:riboflavin kinase/FMN adenylyltransferase
MPFERLTSPERKLELLAAAGVDDIIVVPFDLEFAALSADEFLNLLVSQLRPVALFVGEGFRFGTGRSGDGSTIRAFAEWCGFDAEIVQRLHDGSENLSSSVIRAAVREGRVDDARRFLGRRYRLLGTVEHGVARGRELGYPTANLRLPAWACIPRDGIYAGYAHLDERDDAIPAMIYIGTRPTFDDNERVMEVNILDFSGDLYSKNLEIEFVSHIRDDRAFGSAEELIAHIAQDETDTRALLRYEQPEDERKQPET